MSASASRTAGAREDPWPQMEKQVEKMLSELTVQTQHFRDAANPTVIAENELLDAISLASEAVGDMRYALDTAMEHPETFAISTEDLQKRAEKLRAWERDMNRAEQLEEKIRTAQRRRVQDQSNEADAAHNENSDFLKQEHEIQRDVMQTDDATLDRISGGIHRVRDTAINIGDELETQDHIIDDIDTGMTRVQMRLDGALKKVGKLIDQTSDKGKIICIAVLFVILILLIVVVIR